MRRFAQYWLIGLNLLLLVALVVLLAYVAGLRDDLRETAKAQYTGCKRGNVSRGAVRFLLDARVHDAKLIESTSTNPPIAAYFGGQATEAQQRLDALVDAARLTFPDPKDRFLVDCDKSYPLP